MSWDIQEWILKGAQQVQALGFLVVEIKDETKQQFLKWAGGIQGGQDPSKVGFDFSHIDFALNIDLF